jgi:hypothetical protein
MSTLLKTPRHTPRSTIGRAVAGGRTVSLAGGRPSRPQTMTPLGVIARGLIAGTLGTGAMDTLLFARYKRGGGESDFAAWEFSAGLEGWENAPAPAQVGKRLVEGLFQRELAPERARLVNNVTHWATGLVGAAQYGVVVGSLASRRIGYGVPFGATVWASGYAVLPAVKLYQPIWEYDRKTLANDLSAHLVYGLATAVAFELLSASRKATT